MATEKAQKYLAHIIWAIGSIVVGALLGFVLFGQLQENANTLLGALYAGLFLLSLALAAVGIRIAYDNFRRLIKQQ